VILPETTRVAEGLTVVGASADLLRELLEAYEWECARAGASLVDIYAKGLSPSEIEDRFAAIGIVPPAELVVWWSWYDGVIPGYPPGPLWERLSLDTAIGIYEHEDLGLFEDQWNPDWIRGNWVGSQHRSRGVMRFLRHPTSNTSRCSRRAKYAADRRQQSGGFPLHARGLVVPWTR